MKTLKVICLLTTVLNFSATAYFFEHRTTDKQFFLMAVSGFAFVLSLTSLGAGICFSSRHKLQAFVPLLICVIGLPASLFLGGHLGQVIQDRRFHNNLSRYTAVVELIEKGDLKLSPQVFSINLPAEYADLAWATIPNTNHNGLSIAFMTERGFPVKHSGYLFVSSGDIEADTNALNLWPYHSRIDTNWFHISD